MKISEVLYKEFKHAPTLSEFVDLLMHSNNVAEWFLNEARDSHFGCAKRLIMIRDYNNFLKQPIELKMLVPCKDGEVIDKTLHERLCKTGKTLGIREQQKCYEYQKEKEDVLFSGFEYKDEFFILFPSGSQCSAKEVVEIKIAELEGQPITENYFKFLD